MTRSYAPWPGAPRHRRLFPISETSYCHPLGIEHHQCADNFYAVPKILKPQRSAPRCITVLAGDARNEWMLQSRFEIRVVAHDEVSLLPDVRCQPLDLELRFDAFDQAQVERGRCFSRNNGS